MTVGQMNSKLIKAQEVAMYLDGTLLCHTLLDDAVDYIYNKAGVAKLSKDLRLEQTDKSKLEIQKGLKNLKYAKKH